MSLSVRDIVDRLVRIGADPTLIQERVRHWAREKLLVLDGDQNPGTGRKRLFDPASVHEAAILNQLADIGVSLKAMHLAMAAYRGRVKRIDQALTRRDESSIVLLVLGIDRRAWSGGFVVVSHSDDGGPMADVGTALTGIDSSVVVNLSRLFAKL